MSATAIAVYTIASIVILFMLVPFCMCQLVCFRQWERVLGTKYECDNVSINKASSADGGQACQDKHSGRVC
eukprot:m.114440 g.114440  ORF g.114440 m.114440 type:complete len:71 (+) comp13538_c0_seq1:600-812(+)